MSRIIFANCPKLSRIIPHPPRVVKTKLNYPRLCNLKKVLDFCTSVCYNRRCFATEQDLTNRNLFARNPQKRLDIVVLLLYNRRKHFLHHLFTTLLGAIKKDYDQICTNGHRFPRNTKIVVDLLLGRGGADFICQALNGSPYDEPNNTR